jgi:hypothetical protein
MYLDAEEWQFLTCGKFEGLIKFCILGAVIVGYLKINLSPFSNSLPVGLG